MPHELKISDRHEFGPEYPADHLEARDPEWERKRCYRWNIYATHPRDPVAQVHACYYGDPDPLAACWAIRVKYLYGQTVLRPRYQKQLDDFRAFACL